MGNAIVIPLIFGGIGNQLFIYAAARRLAMKNEGELVLDNVNGFAYDHQYQRHYQLSHFKIPCRMATASERLKPLSRARRYLKRRWNTRLQFDQRSFIHQEGIDFDPRLLALRPKGTLYLEGYWQSEEYFKDVEPQIRADLRIKPPADDQNQRMADLIRQTLAVAVHVRFFDKPVHDQSDSKTVNNAPSDYYQRAIQEMDKHFPNAHYFVFSDRPLAARALIPLTDNRITLVHHNQGDAMAYADLWLMSQCQHFIIANSTFSWWGAWLSNNCTKQIIAPKFVKREGASAWGFKGLIPEQWLLL